MHIALHIYRVYENDAPPNSKVIRGGIMSVVTPDTSLQIQVQLKHLCDTDCDAVVIFPHVEL